MRVLHTADWHVGKTLCGRSRSAEQRAVLAELARIAAESKVDLILVAGDLFDSAAPSAEAEEIVYRGLLDLSRQAPVVAIGGNHDNPRRLAAVRPLFELGRVTLLPAVARPGDGGVVTVKSASGETARIALLPFLHQRGIVRADALMREDAAEHTARYAERVGNIIQSLCEGGPVDALRLLVGHLTVVGGAPGGGERGAHIGLDYAVPADLLGDGLHYAALGHLHRAQRIGGPCPIWYSGSTLQLDFGDTEASKSVNLIEVAARGAARVERLALSSGTRLVRLRSTLVELATLARDVGDAWVSVELDEDPVPGLGDRVREILPQAVEVRLVPRDAIPQRPASPRSGRAPGELFADYLGEQGIEDSGVQALFDKLLEEVHAPAPA